MATACIAHSTLRVHGISKPIVARFDQPHASSDGGAVLVKAVDDRLGLTVRLASAVRDRRQPGKIAHRLRDLVRQRVFGLACGYADCNDAAQLAHDPIHKLLLERDPLDGPALGSQPTLSRFENAVARPDLYRLGSALADTMLVYHHERLGPDVRLITVDLDATDDPTHGQQEFALFNGYYDTWCYLPLVATVTFNTEPMQYLVAALLRPGTGAATRGVRGLLRRLFAKLQRLFPRARVRVRADAGFADASLLAFLEAAGVEYVLGLPSNQRLDKRVRRLLGRARMRAHHRADGDAVRRDALRRAALGPQAPHHHEGRGPLLPRALAQGQSPVPGDQPAASAGHGLHAAVLRPGRHGESAQRTAVRGGHGPHELLALRGQPIPSAALRGSLYLVPSAAGLRARYGRRCRPGPDAARATAEGRCLGRALRPAHCPAPAADLPVARGVAATRPRARRDLTRPASSHPLDPGPRVSRAAPTRSHAHALAGVPSAAIAATPRRAAVSASVVPSPHSLEPFGASPRAFTNSPG